MNKPDIELALMTGIDIPIPELQLVCHSPTVKEIAFMGEANFFGAMQYLCINKEIIIQDKTLLETFSNFQILMKVLGQPENKSKKATLISLLMLLFPKYQVVIMPQSINLLAEGQDPIMVDNNNFDTFQGIIKHVLCAGNLLQGDNLIYNPSGDLAKKIAQKLYKGRQAVAQIKAKEGSNTSVLTRYLSILTVGVGLRLSDCADFNLFQLFDLMDRYNAKVEWDIDLQVRMTGTKPEKQVESWMKEMHTNK